MPDRATEDECEDTIVAAASLLGYRVHVERKARTRRGWRTPIKGHPGWPDLVIVGHGRLIVAELKRKPNRLDPDQAVWLDALRNVTGSVLDVQLLWVPEQMQSFIDYLSACAASPRRVARRG